MERIRPWMLPVYVVCGFILVLLALPQSRWVVLTQIEAVGGGWRTHTEMVIPRGEPYVRPVQRGIEDDDPDPSETPTFLRLIWPRQGDQTVAENLARMEKLFAYCKSKGTPEYLAQAVRIAAFSAMLRGDRLPGTEEGRQRDRRIQNLMVETCRLAEAKDPDNAFFPAMQASALSCLGDEASAWSTFLAASRKEAYRDYARFEPELRYKYLEDRFGFRGYQLRAWILADTILPQLQVVRSTAWHFATNPEGRNASARLGCLMMREERTLIGVIVGRLIFAEALVPKPTLGAMAKLDPKQAISAATQLESAAPGDDGLVEAAKTYSALDHDNALAWPVEDDISLVMNMRPAVSGGSFLSLALLPLALGIAWFKSRRAGLAAGAPYLAWIFVFFLDPLFKYPTNGIVLFGFASLLAIPAAIGRGRRGTETLGVCVTAAALYMSGQYPALAIPAGVFTFSLFVQRRWPELPRWMTIASVLVVCVGVAVAWVFLAINQGGGNGLIFGSIIAISLMLCIPVGRDVRWSPIAGSCCLVLGLVYGTMVYQDISADRQLKQVSDVLLNEGDTVRALSGPSTLLQAPQPPPPLPLDPVPSAPRPPDSLPRLTKGQSPS